VAQFGLTTELVTKGKTLLIIYLSVGLEEELNKELYEANC
jgi:hypothetical protein